MAPEIIFGSGLWGTPMSDFRDPTTISALFNVLKQLKIGRIDTAARYPPMNFGGAERLLGDSDVSTQSLTIDTKVLAANIQDASGDLAPAAIEKSVTDSLARLNVDSVDTLYAHKADPQTPIKDQIIAFNSQVERGRCKQYGLSNHSIDQIKAILQVCEDEGLRKPAVYQGEYNILTRGMESELLPLLRQHRIRYFAYRPLAAGFLTGNVINDQADGTRMAKDSPLGAAYHGVYGSPVLHEAMKRFQDAIGKHQLSTLEVAMRWICHHSALTDTDGVILGTRSTDQLDQDVQWMNKGPLSEDVLGVVDEVWEGLEESRDSVL